MMIATYLWMTQVQPTDLASLEVQRIMMLRSYKELRREVELALTQIESSKKIPNKAGCTLFYGAMLWHLAHESNQVGQEPPNQRVLKIALEDNLSDEVKLLQGWWLQYVGSTLFRPDEPAKHEVRMVKDKNGKVRRSHYIRFDTEHPYLVRGKRLCQASLGTKRETSIGKYYVASSDPKFPSEKLRTLFAESKEPYKWVYLKLILERDSKNPNLESYKRYASELSKMKEPYLILRNGLVPLNRSPRGTKRPLSQNNEKGQSLAQNL